jgi:quinol monooxygenase YgiN
VFGIAVRFDIRDESLVEEFDALVAETVEKIKTDEPGTLIYAVNRIEGEPLARLFYELYADDDAFTAHEAYPHTARMLAKMPDYLGSRRLERLTPQIVKGA